MPKKESTSKSVVSNKATENKASKSEASHKQAVVKKDENISADKKPVEAKKMPPRYLPGRPRNLLLSRRKVKKGSMTLILMTVYFML